MIRLSCGDHAGGQDVPLEHLGIAAQRGDAFLDAGAPGIVEADDRRADLHRLVHDLADLFGMGFAERAAEHREVLAEHEHQSAVDRAVAGHHAVTGGLLLRHAEVDAAVLDEHVPFLERAFVAQDVDPFARGQLALAVLGLDPPIAAALAGSAAHLLQPFQDFAHGYRLSSPASRAFPGA